MRWNLPASARALPAFLVVLLVAGNALLRGGVDMAVVSASLLLAMTAFALATRAAGAQLRLTALAVGLAAAVLTIALQLVPLPPSILDVLSPKTSGAFAEALAPIGLFPTWRPLSLDVGGTGLELAKATCFTAVAATSGLLASSRRSRDAILRGIALSGVLVVAAQLGAALFGAAPLLAPAVTFVNPNNAAGFLLLASWPCLGFALRNKGAHRGAWLVAFAFTASGVFLSLSRAGIASFFVGMGIFVVTRVRATPDYTRDGVTAQGPGSATRRERSGRIVLGLGISSALAIASWLAFAPIVSELRTISDEGTVATKLSLWPLAARIVRDFPLTGIGRGAFATVSPSYKSEPANVTFTHVENELLQLPVELGLVAGSGVVLLFAWAFLVAVRRPALSRPLAGALAGAGAAAAQSLFDFGLEVPGVAIPFAVVLGIAAREMPGISSTRAQVRTGAGALLVLAAAGLGIHVLHPTDADAAAVAAATTADEASRRAQAALRWHPADFVPHFAVGAKLVAERRCGEAYPWLERAMLRNPTAPEPHRVAGWCLARLGRKDLARREYRLAVAFGDPDALREASALFPGPGALLDIAPETPDGLLMAAALLRDRPAEAAEACRRAWNEFHDPRALAPLGQALLHTGDADAAVRIARISQSEAPRDAAGYLVAAFAHDALGQPDEALAALELGAARIPGSAAVLSELGSRHLAHRRFAAAKTTFDGIVARDRPTLAMRHLLVARALEGQSRLLEALKHVQAARELTPSDPRAHHEFGRLAESLGRYDEAIEAAEATARLARTPAERDARVLRISELQAKREERRLRRAVDGVSR